MILQLYVQAVVKYVRFRMSHSAPDPNYWGRRESATTVNKLLLLFVLGIPS